MRLIFIFCFTSLFLCIKCGLIKNLLGTVSNDLHKVTDGNVIKNVAHMIHNETKEIVQDFGDLLHSRKNKNNENNKATETNEGNKHEDVSNHETKVTEIAPNNNQDNNKLHPEPTAAQVPEVSSNKNQAAEPTNVLVVSSKSPNSVSIDEGYHYGEGTISPRFGRHIKMDITNAENKQETQDINVDENVVVDENLDPSIIYNFTDVNDMININMPSENVDIEVVVVSDCPEGQEMALNGTCFDIETSTEARGPGKNRANFSGGCFYGFEKAADGTCQEVIYD